MRKMIAVLVLAGAALLTLSACGGSDREPRLMNLRSSTNGPDEFSILPPKPLELPEIWRPCPSRRRGRATAPTRTRWAMRLWRWGARSLWRTGCLRRMRA